MDGICLICPDRGDRPPLFEFAVKQINKIGMGKAAYLMNERPISSEVDLVPRVRKGIEMAKRDGFEFVLIFESDDWYPVNYMEHFNDFDQYDFIGFSSTTYYNIRNSTYETFKHKDRSSLFCTGFRISALEGFNWPNDNTPFLDIRVWDFAIRMNKRVLLHEDNPCLGVKHGMGLTGGKAHKMHLKNSDHNSHFLKTYVDDQSFEFYQNLKAIL